MLRYIETFETISNTDHLYARMCVTRSSTEVAHFRYFVSERRGSFTPNRRTANLDFEKKRFVDLGHGIIRRDAFRFLLTSVFG